MKLRFAAVPLLGLVAGYSASAAPILWTNLNPSGDHVSWYDPFNWNTSAVPTSSSNVQIAENPELGFIGIDNGGATTTIASLAFTNTAASEIKSATGTDSLTINGAVTNGSTANQTLNLQVIAGADATYLGGVGGLTFARLTVGTFDLATTGTISITSDLIFTIDSINLYGSIGAVSVTGATTVSITLTPSYTPQAGDTFDFTTGSFAGAVLGPLPSLPGGFFWDSSQLLSQGVLVVAVPEPSTTYMLIAGGLTVLLIFRRRGNPQPERVAAVVRRRR